MTSDLVKERREAAFKALDSLSRYKFMMFGYWAAIWVHLNAIAPSRDRSPFAFLVSASRHYLIDNCGHGVIRQSCNVCKGKAVQP